MDIKSRLRRAGLCADMALMGVVVIAFGIIPVAKPVISVISTGPAIVPVALLIGTTLIVGGAIGIIYHIPDKVPAKDQTTGGW